MVYSNTKSILFSGLGNVRKSTGAKKDVLQRSQKWFINNRRNMEKALGLREKDKSLKFRGKLWIT